jgi:hypothetical protein
VGHGHVLDGQRRVEGEHGGPVDQAGQDVVLLRAGLGDDVGDLAAEGPGVALLVGALPGRRVGRPVAGESAAHVAGGLRLPDVRHCARWEPAGAEVDRAELSLLIESGGDVRRLQRLDRLGFARSACRGQRGGAERDDHRLGVEVGLPRPHEVAFGHRRRDVTEMVGGLGAAVLDFLPRRLGDRQAGADRAFQGGEPHVLGRVQVVGGVGPVEGPTAAFTADRHAGRFGGGLLVDRPVRLADQPVLLGRRLGPDGVEGAGSQAMAGGGEWVDHDGEWSPKDFMRSECILGGGRMTASGPSPGPTGARSP